MFAFNNNGLVGGFIVVVLSMVRRRLLHFQVFNWGGPEAPTIPWNGRWAPRQAASQAPKSCSVRADFEYGVDVNSCICSS